MVVFGYSKNCKSSEINYHVTLLTKGNIGVERSQ